MSTPFNVDKSNAKLAGAFLGVATGIIVLWVLILVFGPKLFVKAFDDGRAAHPSEHSNRR